MPEYDTGIYVKTVSAGLWCALGPCGRVGRRCPAGPSPLGVAMLDVGNGGFSHFHETAGSHFQATRWKCQKPGKLPFSDVQLYFYEGEYCEHLRRFLRRQRTNGQPASAEVLLSRSIRVYSTGSPDRSRSRLLSIRKHTRDAMAFRE